MGQFSFFDADKRLAAISVKGDPLEMIDRVVPFENFRAESGLERFQLRPPFQHLPLIASSVFFGLYHYEGGLTYIAFATIAGAFYGFAYMSTKRIESAILVHFGLNLTHFL